MSRFGPGGWFRWMGLPVVFCLLLLGGGEAGAQTASVGVPAAPLSRDDPRARLDPELLDLPPIPAPRVGASPRASRPALGTVTYDAPTGRTTLGALPAEARLWARGRHPWRVATGDRGYPGPMGARVRTIFGNDDRERRSPTTDFPWRAQCQLVMKFPDGKRFWASGTLIGPNDVLTAAHAMYDKGHGGMATEVEVIPGLDGTYMPYGSAKMRAIQLFQAWIDREDWEYDLALITLDRNIGTSTGWMTYGYFPTVIGATAHLAAYPLDKEDGALYYAFGPIDDATDQQLFYRIDTTPGMSGGGLYQFFEEDRWVFAVHSGSWEARETNFGTRIDPVKFETLRAWKHGND